MSLSLRTAFDDRLQRRHGDVDVSPRRRLPTGLISAVRSLMSLQTADVFRPSPPTALSLTRRFTLSDVSRLIGTGLYGYDGFVCRPSSHHESRLRAA
jgi:hypothetical protein